MTVYRAGDNEPLGVAITRVLEEVTETESKDLPPLYESVDTDALEALFSGRPDGWITFEHAGCQMSVHSDGEISPRRVGITMRNQAAPDRDSPVSRESELAQESPASISHQLDKRSQ